MFLVLEQHWSLCLHLCWWCWPAAGRNHSHQSPAAGVWGGEAGVPWIDLHVPVSREYLPRVGSPAHLRTSEVYQSSATARSRAFLRSVYENSKRAFTSSQPTECVHPRFRPTDLPHPSCWPFFSFVVRGRWLDPDPNRIDRESG